jgi:cytochrome c oxidase subunit 4
MNGHPPSLPRLVAVYLGLMVLLSLSAASTLLAHGGGSSALGLGIAGVKAFLIAAFFMRLREQPVLVRVFALAGLFWLALLIGLTATDYLSRSWPA